MKIVVKQDLNLEETEIIIRYGKNEKAQTEILITQLPNLIGSIVGYRNGASHRLLLQDVYYIESVDEKCFLYTASQVYETPKKLYEWEDQLDTTSFVRISKSTIVNTNHLKSVRSLLSGKLEATLSNGEKQVVNRHYVTGFRKKFGI